MTSDRVASDFPGFPNGRSVAERFIAEDASHATVQLEHRGFERHGAAAQGIHNGVVQGWSCSLEPCAKQAAA